MTHSRTGTNGGDPSSFPQSALNLIYDSALTACDSLDGLEDGLISAPLNCSFDPATLACPTSASSPSCLSASQLATARAFYSGAVDPVTHEQLYPGFVPGSELTWAGEAGIYDQFATAIFENTWAMNLSYDPLADFNFHTDVKKASCELLLFLPCLTVRRPR